MNITIRLLLVFTLCLAAVPAAIAQETDLTTLTLEDLLDIEVTSVARKAQTLGHTAAAVHVITREDIRRSGAQTIPDLLRMVPGFSVARIDAGSYAIGARGFSALYANKLLVLIDGRSAYTPMFGGVHWDMQNLPLGDIDRIEVIRGPGGSLWGANATNGVVNIITKDTGATLGARATAETGGEERSDVHLRYGGSLGEFGHYRAYARHVQRGWSAELDGISLTDPGEAAVGGARFDWARGTNRFALHGSAQQGHSDRVRTHMEIEPFSDTIIRERTAYHDSNVVFSWTHSSSEESQFGVQTYFEHRSRDSSIEDSWYTFDVDARYRRGAGRHDLVTGAGFRFWSNDVTAGTFRIEPGSEQMGTVSAFAQDEIELVKDRLSATAGAKLEYNRYADLQFQPSARVTWTPDDANVIWGAVSRAVRTPTRTDRGMQVPIAVTPGPRRLPLVITLEGSPAFEPETLDALEAGYRTQYRAMSVDVAAFVNEYDNLQNVETGAMTMGFRDLPNAWRLPLQFGNGARATTWGAEVSATWRVTDWWKVVGAYAWLDAASDATSSGEDDTSADSRSVPAHQAHARTYVDLPANFEVSVLAFRIGELPSQDIPAYTRVDLRLGWTRRAVELAIGAQNLGHGGDREFSDPTGLKSPTITPRAFAQIGVRF